MRKSQDYLMKCLGFVLLFGFISLGAIGGCNTDSGTSSGITVRQIGELNSVHADGIAAQVRLIPFEGGSDTPIILQGETIFTLNDEEKEALIETYDAGLTIVLLDAEEPAIDEFLEIIDDGISWRSDTHDILLAYIARNEGHYTARLVAEPVPGPNHDSTLETSENIIVSELGAPPPELLDVDVVSKVDVTTADLQQFPIVTKIFSIPQPNLGAFNTTIRVYAAHQCQTGNDHFVVETVSNWTPGSSFQKTDSVTSINWVDGENRVCPNHDKGGKRNTGCRFIEYPKFYRVELMPVQVPISDTIFQSEAAPQATQGTDTTYSSGVTFNVGGRVSIKGGPSASAGVTWSNTKSVTVPPINIKAGNLEDAGAFWQFEYCTESNKSNGSDCVNTIQTANPSNICQNQLGKPQQGQTTNGKFSNAAQTVHWIVDPEYRQAGATTFDIKVTFQAALAETLMLRGFIPAAGFKPTVFGTCKICSPFSGCCNCGVETTDRDDDATKNATLPIGFPPIDCD